MKRVISVAMGLASVGSFEARAHAETLRIPVTVDTVASSRTAFAEFPGYRVNESYACRIAPVTANLTDYDRVEYQFDFGRVTNLAVPGTRMEVRVQDGCVSTGSGVAEAMTAEWDAQYGAVAALSIGELRQTFDSTALYAGFEPTTSEWGFERLTLASDTSSFSDEIRTYAGDCTCVVNFELQSETLTTDPGPLFTTADFETLIDVAVDDGTFCGDRGGIVVYSGVDGGAGAGSIPNDGILQVGERLSSYAVCSAESGTDGHNAAVSVTEEAAGGNCPNGGHRIAVGVDLNDNEVLDTDEVTSTEYVCNGEDGADGEDGVDGRDGGSAKTSLSRLDALATGDAMCAAGGVAVSIGIDEDADGVLSDSEITDTQRVCAGVNGADGGCAVNGGRSSLLGLSMLLTLVALVRRRLGRAKRVV